MQVAKVTGGAHSGCTSTTVCPSQLKQPRLPSGRPRRARLAPTCAIDPTSLVDVVNHLPLLYEPVALPCSLYRCGDVVHRSTLDLALRGELGGPDWRTFLLLASVGAYLFATPGVAPGAIDYYWITRFRRQHPYSKDDIQLGRKLATGGFGTVFRGTMKLASGEVADVIVKKAKEFGQAEAWMNERMMRLPGGPCAEFITAFDESLSNSITPRGAAKKAKANAGPAPVWLVWRYEGDNNLYDLMESKEFPYNLEPLLLNRELQLPEGVQRKAVTIKLAMKQLLEALAAAHSTGIVHRDIKPQNCIISERDKKIKLIDLGAAADLRVGINYVPSEYLLDPRYAPPQQYIMSTQTPQPPPAPVAAFLSPILWRMENPDRFDMWACGVTLLQMAFPALRNDNAIIAFNKRLENLKWDLRAWRREEESRKGGMKPDTAEGFALLDLDGGAGWELLCNLMAYKPTDRWTAREALLSPFFTGLGITSPVGAIKALSSTQAALSTAGKWMGSVMDPALLEGISNAATGKDKGSLTEAQLRQELGLEEPAPVAPRRASSTIAWWQERQSFMQESIKRRESTQPSSLPMKGSKGSRGSRSVTPSRSATPPPAPAPVPVQGSSWLSSPFKNIRSPSPALGNGSGNGNGNGKNIRSPSPALGNGNGAYVNGNGNGGTAGVRKPLAGLLVGLNRKEGSAAVRREESSESEEDEREVELVGSFNLLGKVFKSGKDRR